MRETSTCGTLAFLQGNLAFFPQNESFSGFWHYKKEGKSFEECRCRRQVAYVFYLPQRRQKEWSSTGILQHRVSSWV